MPLQPLSDLCSNRRHPISRLNKSASGEELNPRIASITVSNPVKNLAVIVNPNQIPLKWKGKQIHDYDPLCHCWITDLGNTSIDKLEYNSDNTFNQVDIQRENNKYTVTTYPVDVVGAGLYFAPYGFGNGTDGRSDFEGIGRYGNAFYLQTHYGKNILTTQDYSLFVNAGLGIDNNNIAYSGDYETHYNSTDKDTDDYIRNIYANIDKERWHTFGLTVPVSATFLLNLDNGRQNSLFLSVDAGIFVSYRAIVSNSFNTTTKYSGTYPQYFNVELDNIEQYGYGEYTLDNHNLPIVYKERIKRLDFGFSLGAGIWYKLNDQSFLKFDAMLRKGFAPTMSYNGKPYVITEDKDTYTPIIYSSNKGICNLYLGVSYIMLLSGK